MSTSNFILALGYSLPLALITLLHGDDFLDVANLKNYSNQVIPTYITKDNSPEHNSITNEGSTLGRVLFYDKRLSADNTISCASCHQQEHAFSDLAVLSEGINGNLTPRHSMRLVNARFGDEVKFRWDETAESLEEQMIIPIKAEKEMGYSGENGNPGMSDLIAELAATSFYPPLFNLAFGDPTVTEERMGLALAQFVRSIQSFDSKYDAGRAQVSDDLTDFPNFTNDENAGKRLFIEDFQWEEATHTVADVPGDPGGTFNVAMRVSGGFNCATCHQPPEFSIDPGSLNNAFVRPPSNFPGDPSWLVGTRSPTLRDLIKADWEAEGDNGEALNGGMFHSGQALFLKDIFGHYEFRRLDEDDNTNLDPRLMRVSPTTGENMAQLLNSTARERRQISAFLSTLTGSNVYTDEKWSDPFDEAGNLTLSNELAINAIDYQRESDQLTIDWRSLPGASYTLWSSPDLSEGSWSIVQEGIPASTDNFRTPFGPFAAPSPLRSFFRVSDDSSSPD
ncbi:cytochrome-c peroxidase [Rubritalea marina]|uniref:cytochrome-c peroxidase n=1 Tax=Rubritalea marina TaxID=361055 RepID=UPI000374BF9E|nr:cytochrome-c peroxidase [Rubritalea marina]